MNSLQRGLLSVGLFWAFDHQTLQALTLESTEEKVNLLELYTSHGCSSCPPADAWLRKLESHPGLWKDLIPVAFHVDYWDDLGWPDRFASPAFSNRQRELRRQGAIRSVYTPSFILNGQEWRQWFSRPVLDLPVNERVGRLSLEVNSGVGARIRFTPRPQLEGIEFEAHFAILGFGLASTIKGGENRGRVLEDSFVVLNHQKTAPGRREWRFDWPIFSSEEAQRLGVVAWLTRPGSSRQVQAVGGWLQ
jgi:hypothetical protein